MKAVRIVVCLLMVVAIRPAYPSSIYWADGEKLPETFTVRAFSMEPWGTRPDQTVMRVTFRNDGTNAVYLLNLSFWNSQFVVTRPDGGKHEISVKLESWQTPETNPGMTIGLKSEVGFDLDIEKLKSDLVAEKDDVNFQVEVRFVLLKFSDTSDERSIEQDKSLAFHVPLSISGRSKLVIRKPVDAK